jgi:copper homeostasis protein (lipoprotein)
LTLRAARAIAVRTNAVLLLATFATTSTAHGPGPLPASFSGVLPCADCMWRRQQLNLFPGGGFVLALTYFRDGRDETFYEVGNYTISADSSVISLATHDPAGTRFALQGPDVTRLLDRDGQAIDTKFKYDLRRGPCGHDSGVEEHRDRRSWGNW